VSQSFGSVEGSFMVEPKQGEGPESLDDSTLIDPVEPSPSSQPASVGRFEIARLIAQGSYTRIYEVTAPNASGSRLALKSLNTESESVSRWFERGVSNTGSLNHPHILPCHESGRHEGSPYMVMPLVDGTSVQELVHRQAFPEPVEVVRIARAVASALDYAHGRGVVHGDVHPKHVLLDRTGYVWLTGFAEVGCGRPEEMCFGNPHHLAPEQFTGFENTVPQTDVYALGEVAFLLLTGSFPFRGGIFELLERKRSGPVPSIRERRPELPRLVDLTLQRAMAVRPEDRFRSAGKLVEELDAGFVKRWWQIWR
jgi:serine/threonine-protein kinase